jgi:hypothetical protein
VISNINESPFFVVVAPMIKVSLGDPGVTLITDSAALHSDVAARRARMISFMFFEPFDVRPPAQLKGC